MSALVLRSRRVLLPEGERPASVHVADGRIVAIDSYLAESPPEGETTPASGPASVDLGDTVLLPGLVDTHVHVNEPGRTEWEGFATVTRAAAAGGVTTLVDMPLNSIPPTVDAPALAAKRSAAQGQCHVDVGFWGGAVPGNAQALPPLHDAGVFGFKCFLIDSGVPEFPPLTAAELDTALSMVDTLFLVHAEDPQTVRPAPPSPRYADFLASRPPQAETRAVALALDAARRTGARVHILHLSAAEVIPLLADARAEGIRVTAETCPHYLTLAAEQIPDGATPFKCCPPIRNAGNRTALWDGLATGAIDCIVSDHSPCTADLKRTDTGDFAAAWGGIASVQLGLSVVWTTARQEGFTLGEVVNWMSRRPADLVGLGHKGRIEVGADADLVAFDPGATWVVDPATLHHRNPVTPYAGQTLHGVVRRTWLRGVPVDGVTPHGRLLTRER
jgi:allantoinase